MVSTFAKVYLSKIMIRSRDLARWLKDLTDELNSTGIIGIKEFSRVQVRFLMLNTICLTSLHIVKYPT